MGHLPCKLVPNPMEKAILYLKKEPEKALWKRLAICLKDQSKTLRLRKLELLGQIPQALKKLVKRNEFLPLLSLLGHLKFRIEIEEVWIEWIYLSLASFTQKEWNPDL